MPDASIVSYKLKAASQMLEACSLKLGPGKLTTGGLPFTILPMRALLLLIALAVLLVGCGNKGPLYLPKPKPGTEKPGQPTPTPPELPPDDTRLGDR